MAFLKKRIVTLAAIIAIVAFYGYRIGVDSDKVAEMQLREKELKQQISEKKVELGRLEDYDEMSRTPEFVERMAREKLGMVKKNEIIYYIQHKFRGGEREQ